MSTRILLFTLITLVASVKAQTIDEAFEFEGVSRTHKVFLPTNYVANMPLVLNLHGYTSNAWQQSFYSGMNTVAEANDFIVVYPDGTTDQNGISFWNSEIAGEEVNDLGYLSALIDSMIVNYHINPSRVYMCGMSNGGFMSYYSACQMTDRLAAIASVTGTMNNVIYDNCNPSRSIPVLEIHGTLDATVPYIGLENSGSFQTMIGTEEVIDFWVNQNNCTQELVVELEDVNVLDLSTVTHFAYSDGDNGVSVEHYRINNGGHTWPGASIGLPPLVTNYDINASEVIWNFFNQYDVDGALNANEIPDQASFSINPNPIQTTSRIKASFMIESYSIYDLQGKLLRKEFVHDSELEINKGSFQSGLYLLEVFGESNRLMQQLLVL